MRDVLLAVLAAALLSACGQRGPLYLRDKPPPGFKPQKDEIYRPTPYPKDLGGEAGQEGGGTTDEDRKK